MDRRSWLWRRKSSEKSPGETESSGSLSSHSEKFSDDQGYPTHNTQSPEVTSKPIPADEEVNDNVKILKEKLSAAVLNISAKEELVKQHAKVAEEAVSGWEKADNEVVVLKQQLEAATQKNSALENRVGHLDGALKECVRQLRQGREEQEQKIQEAIGKRIHEWESTKAELEHQLLELQTQLKTAKTETVALVDSDHYRKLEAAERENSRLQLELLSRAEEIEFRILERDLSTEAAETASKQHLESIKKVAKLEAECRRLKAVARKMSPANDHRSFSVSSIYAESFADSQSDNGERLLAVESDMRNASSSRKNEGDPSQSEASSVVTELDPFKNKKTVTKNLVVPPLEINLMDDFLEMERLAALPDTASGNSYLEAGPVSDQADSGESVLKAELEAATYRTSELEEKLEKMEQEKEELGLELAECQRQIEISRGQVKEAEMKLMELNSQLALATCRTSELEDKLEKMEQEKEELGLELTKCQRQIEISRGQLKEAEIKLMELNSQLALATYRTSEMEEKQEKMEQEKEELGLELTECQRQIEISRGQLNEAEMKLIELNSQLALANGSKQAAVDEMTATDGQRKMAESQLRVAEDEIKTLGLKIGSLEADLENERALSAENIAKCQKLDDELLRMKNEAKLKHEAAFQSVASVNAESKIKQDKELAVAASKLAECQKTISSLGRQLKSLATLEDFLIDFDKPVNLTNDGLPSSRRGFQ
ncbi:hypothetical protein HS088_TW07G00629 [Tripterygium wilfordii]|uniref:Filament-like plant protein n=1 Tax=Tripterygium wilfordii TaxID=458696 RepID=A0A7J7DFK5_TRIWF|nr:filament-like plant protein 3 [Tripterygium wilfordii]XP_038705592.1 filament-like plant protein 3 [Tripterygium wilfordii]XP_038705593.1 filament-like plant protein 3 [Tripterygium wilfordii]XP_038705594.1 filament-like plant protein 3 [Tripterygium wilfordii]XP_038705595.1 filament-like plant protein 3 [Tripterygium wilfordii]XP_038705596.1 filament-like plant protein 3 [Tripterygium wilfordii]KAF5745048.1 hypothetical protein HS088_TW07G00629 [Tripterygium wilfordii]